MRTIADVHISRNTFGDKSTRTLKTCCNATHSLCPSSRQRGVADTPHDCFALITSFPAGRPYIIVENMMPRLTEQHTSELNMGVRNFEDCLKDGLVEYLDVNEENDSRIAIVERFIGTCVPCAVTRACTHALSSVVWRLLRSMLD